jgi:hypothetical protein
MRSTLRHVGVGGQSGKGCLEAGTTVRLVEWRVSNQGWRRKADLTLKKSIFETTNLACNAMEEMTCGGCEVTNEEDRLLLLFHENQR